MTGHTNGVSEIMECVMRARSYGINAKYNYNGSANKSGEKERLPN
jgi:hypothetical protein